MSTRHLPPPLLLTALLLAPACDNAPGVGKGDSNVPGDTVEGGCETPMDCSPGTTCVGGWCMVSNYGSPCANTDNCAVGICDPIGKICVMCVSHDDCPLGFSCNAAHECEGGTPGDSDDPGGDSDPGFGDHDPGFGDHDPGPGDSDPGGAAELTLCAGDGDCAPGLVCRAMTKGGTPQRCTRPCSGDADCPSGLRCVNDGTGDVCLYDDVGRACSAADQCYAFCALGPGYCTRTCAGGADCPNGYGCQPVGTPSQDVCVRVEAVCDASDASACIAPAACDTSAAMVVAGCTLACDSAADCPARAQGLPPWTCDVICRRPGDVYGPQPGGDAPAEYYCDASSQPINLCNDGLHIDFVNNTVPAPPAVDCGAAMSTPGIATDACVNSCRYQGGCPSGFSCTAVGSAGGGRIGLCIPNGTGEVGTACSVHVDCAFGYCANGACSRDCTDDGVCPGSSTCVDGDPPAVEGATFRRCE